MGKLWESLFRCLLIPDQLLVWGKKVMLYCGGVKDSLLFAMALSAQFSVLFSSSVNTRMCAAGA